MRALMRKQGSCGSRSPFQQCAAISGLLGILVTALGVSLSVGLSVAVLMLRPCVLARGSVLRSRSTVVERL
jgi:hypothetical protein